MEEFTHLLTGWLITFGFAFTASSTDGPFNLFWIARKKIQSTTDHQWVRNGVECPICASCWLGIIVAVLMSDSIQNGILMWASSIGFTCVINSLSPDSSDDDD